MATGTFYWYSNVLAKALNKEINFLSDTIKAMLCTSSYVPNQDTHIYKDISVTNEVTGTGYPAGGFTLANKTLTVDGATNITKLDADDITVASTTITGSRVVVIYDDTPASNKPLLGYCVYDSDVSTNNGTLTITFDAAGMLKATVS